MQLQQPVPYEEKVIKPARPSTAGPGRRRNDKRGRQVIIHDEMETVSSLDTRRNTAVIQG